MDSQADGFTRAIAFAAQAHAGQVRKGSDTPYIVHPMEAAAVCATVTDDAEVLAAAVLHDVVEDTEVTAWQVERRFGARVAALVAGESEDKRPDRPASETWQVRKEESLERLRTAQDPGVLVVCLGDKLSNIRSIERDLREQGDAFWSRFNQKDPARHAWYYRALADIMEPALGSTHAWREFRALVDAVFAD